MAQEQLYQDINLLIEILKLISLNQFLQTKRHICGDAENTVVFYKISWVNDI